MANKKVVSKPKKSTVQTKKCKDTLESALDTMLDSLFIAVADPVEDIYGMAVKAKAALHAGKTAQAEKLLDAIVAYIDDFLAEDDEEEDCDCCGEDCDCDVEEIDFEVEDDEDEAPAKPKKRRQ